MSEITKYWQEQSFGGQSTISVGEYPLVRIDNNKFRKTREERGLLMTLKHAYESKMKAKYGDNWKKNCKKEKIYN